MKRGAAHVLHALDGDAGQDDRQQHLADLGGLQVERADVDPAVGSLDRGAHHEHDGQRSQQAAPQAPRPARELVEVEAGGDDHQRRADRDEQDLPVDVEARVAGHVVLGGLADDEDAEAADGDDGQQHDPVEAAHQAAQAVGGGGRGAAPGGDGAHRLTRRLAAEVGVELEVGAHRAAHRRSGRVGAGAAALDDHRDHDLGVVEGRVADEPGVVLAPVARLGGAGLAGHLLVGRQGAEDAGGGAVGAVGGLVEALLDGGQVGRADVDLLGGPPLGELLHHAPVGVEHLTAEGRRAQRAAVGDGAVGHRHLQRGGQQVALAHAELDAVAGEPAALEVGVLRALEVLLLPDRRRASGRSARRGCRCRSSRPARTSAPRPAAGTRAPWCPACSRACRPPGRRTCRWTPRGPWAA